MKTFLAIVLFAYLPCADAIAGVGCNMFAAPVYSTPVYSTQVYQQEFAPVYAPAPAYAPAPVCVPVGLQPGYLAAPSYQQYSYAQQQYVAPSYNVPQYNYAQAAVATYSPGLAVQNYYPTALNSNYSYASNIYAARNFGVGYGVQYNNVQRNFGQGHYHNNVAPPVNVQIGRNIGRGFAPPIDVQVGRNVGRNFAPPANVQVNNAPRGTDVILNPPGLFNRTRIRVR